MYETAYPAHAAPAFADPSFGAECWGGGLSWVPLKGCDWLAGAKHARDEVVRNVRESWLPGVRYAFAVGDQDGVKALVDEVGQASAVAAISGTQWTLAEAGKAVDLLVETVDGFKAKKRAYEQAVAKLPSAERAAANRDVAAQLAGFAQPLADGVRKLGSLAQQAQGPLQAKLQRARSSVEGVRFGDGGALTGTALAVAIVAICLTLIALFVTAGNVYANRLASIQSQRKWDLIETLPPSVRNNPDAVEQLLDAGAPDRPVSTGEELGRALKKAAPWLLGGAAVIALGPPLISAIGGALAAGALPSFSRD